MTLDRDCARSSLTLPWVTLGFILVAGQLVISSVSADLQSHLPIEPPAIVTLVACLLVTGFGYLGLMPLVNRSSDTRKLFVFILTVGVLMRFCAVMAPPILDDDFNRYLWDGAVSAKRLNPYAFSPHVISAGGAPESYAAVGNSAPPELTAQINYPELRTVYPPVAQVAFAAAHWLEPWSLNAWRSIVILSEILSAVLLLALLSQLGQSRLWLALYWWNPLVVHELVNSAHIDALLIPLLLGALYLFETRRCRLGSLVLGAAVGVKLWPVLLALVVALRMSHQPRELGVCAALFLAVLAIQLVPIMTPGLDPQSGFIAYGQLWEMNDALFMAVVWCFEQISSHAQLLARVAMALLVLATAFVAGLWRTDELSLAGAFLLVTAAVFLLSPTQFPWYYSWLVCLLVFARVPALLLLTPLLSLYYLRFYFELRDMVWLFDRWLVWLEFVPVWAMLALQWWCTRKSTGRNGVAL